MRRTVCFALLLVAAFAYVAAYAGDAPIRWKNAPGLADTEVYVGAITTDATTFALTTADWNSTGTLDYTPSYHNVTMAPAAVRFEPGMAICPHCDNEYNVKKGRHTIHMDGTNGTFETCVDNVILMMSARQLGRWLIDEDDDE